jgi:hypothetical protein
MIANPFSFVVSSESSTPTSDPYRTWDRIMESVQLDLKTSSTTHLPDDKGSTITESPTGPVQPSSSNAEQHEQQQVVQKHVPQLLHQQQQREERHPQQVFPTTLHTPRCLRVGMCHNISRHWESPKSHYLGAFAFEIMDTFSRSKNVHSETRRRLHSVGTLADRTQ